MPLFRRTDKNGETIAPTSAVRTLAFSVDILAIWATILGVVTSLGLGALQITSGLSITWGIGGGSFTCSVVVVIITLLFVLSALSGLKRGIRYLSLLNVSLMLLLLAFFFVFGPFKFLFDMFFTALQDYLAAIIPRSTTFRPV